MAELHCSVKDPVLLSNIIHNVTANPQITSNKNTLADRDSPELAVETSSTDSLSYSEENITSSLVKIIYPLDNRPVDYSDTSSDDDSDNDNTYSYNSNPISNRPTPNGNTSTNLHSPIGTNLAPDNIDTLYTSLSQIISILNTGLASVSKENKSIRYELNSEKKAIYDQIADFKQTAASLRTQLVDIRNMLVQILNCNMQNVKRDIQRLQTEIDNISSNSQLEIQNEIRNAVRKEITAQLARQNDFISEANVVLQAVRDKLRSI